MNGQVLRPRFGQPCFECGESVPEPRSRVLREEAQAERRRFLKSDVICPACEAERIAAAGAPRRRQ